MFDNIGGKIKTMADYLLYIGITLIVGGGIVGLFFVLRGATGSDFDGWILLQYVLGIILGCCLVSFISTILYGFGEIIERTQEIAKNTKNISNLVAEFIQKEKNDAQDNSTVKNVANIKENHIMDYMD